MNKRIAHVVASGLTGLPLLISVAAGVACGKMPRTYANKSNILVGHVRDNAARDNAAQDSARRFVQEFLNWYVPIVQDTSRHREASSVAVERRSELFDPVLVAALRADAASQDSSPGEIVGIDWDPFLGGQDPCQRYEAGNVARHHEGYLVEIYSICDGAKSTKPDNLAEVMNAGGHWRFVNFRTPNAPDSADLMIVLKALREDREKEKASKSSPAR